MIWLTEYDLKKQIRQSVLSQVIEQDASLLHEAELATLAEIESYLRSRFDVQAIFATTGTDRNALLVMYAVDMLLYHLHSRINPNQIPDLRIERYNNAIEWLKAVAKGMLSPALPAIETNENSTKFMIGSQKRRRL
jgi:phage gp36-like protein